MQFVAELRLLGLAGRCYGYDDYRERLASFLDIRIEVALCNDTDHPLLARRLRFHGIAGGLLVDLDGNTARVLVPSSLGRKLQAKTVYHELGHLAGGHPLRQANVLAGDPGTDGAPSGLSAESLWYPERRLALRDPPDRMDLCEREADLRSGYALKAGLYGDAFFDRDELFLGYREF